MSLQGPRLRQCMVIVWSPFFAGQALVNSAVVNLAPCKLMLCKSRFCNPCS